MAVYVVQAGTADGTGAGYGVAARRVFGVSALKRVQAFDVRLLDQCDAPPLGVVEGKEAGRAFVLKEPFVPGACEDDGEVPAQLPCASEGVLDGAAVTA
ncbi:hypothetical protein GCM10010342_72100 [Streptomyces anulatus]|nr:hypothetical protein GCM10010342_72100 [Streptomyces anulatus]